MSRPSALSAVLSRTRALSRICKNPSLFEIINLFPLSLAFAELLSHPHTMNNDTVAPVGSVAVGTLSKSSNILHPIEGFLVFVAQFVGR